MTYTDLYNHIAINGASCKREADELMQIRSIEKLRKQLISTH